MVSLRIGRNTSRGGLYLQYNNARLLTRSIALVEGRGIGKSRCQGDQKGQAPELHVYCQNDESNAGPGSSPGTEYTNTFVPQPHTITTTSSLCPGSSPASSTASEPSIALNGIDWSPDLYAWQSHKISLHLVTSQGKDTRACSERKVNRSIRELGEIRFSLGAR